MRARTRFLSAILSIVLVVGLCPAPAYAGDSLMAQGAILTTQASNPYPQYNYYNSSSDYQISCTWYAWQQAYNRLGIALPGNWGNGGQWYDSARAAGYSVGSTPRANSLAVYNGYDAWGHVEFVTAVSGSTITVNTGGYDPATPPGTKDGLVKSGVVGQNHLVGYVYLTSNDKTGPSYSDFHVGEINDSQFTVMAKVTDPSGIRSVRYAVWTDSNGQDDIKWYDGHCTDGNNYYWARISYSDHKGEKGRYTIHMYAYDNAGNLTNPGIAYDFSTSGPQVTDFHVGELREGAFTVMAKVTDPNGVGSVRYAIWTEKDGQDDIKWYTGNHTDNNGYFWARVKFSDHKGEKGKYIIHLYAYDSNGKLTNPGLSYYFDEHGPEISDISVSDVSAKGYTVTCRVTDETGLLRVQFPTWTNANDQDDIAANWETNTNVSGTVSGDVVTFRVKTSDHNGELGSYRTHIYAYDVLGNRTAAVVPDVNVHNHAYSTKLVPATFTEDGAISSICSICGDESGVTTIAKASDVALSATSYTYDGKVHVPVITVKDSNGSVLDSQNYMINFADASPVSVGTYNAIITLKDSYTGTKSVSFAIKPAAITSVAVSPSSYTYDGKAKTPSLTVKAGSLTVPASGYTATYSNNVNAGTARVTVTGKGNFDGTTTATFEITAPSGSSNSGEPAAGTRTSVASAKVSGVASKTYTGKPIVQNPTIKIGSSTLKSGTDYKLSYSSNVKVGTATMKVTGKGSYTGTKTVKFAIKRADVKFATAAKVKDRKYTGKAIKPSPKLTYKGKALKKGADYTLSYKNNKKRGIATITAKGKGNFKGTKTVRFKIK